MFKGHLADHQTGGTDFRAVFEPMGLDLYGARCAGTLEGGIVAQAPAASGLFKKMQKLPLTAADLDDGSPF